MELKINKCKVLAMLDDAKEKSLGPQTGVERYQLDNSLIILVDSFANLLASALELKDSLPAEHSLHRYVHLVTGGLSDISYLVSIWNKSDLSAEEIELVKNRILLVACQLAIEEQKDAFPAESDACPWISVSELMAEVGDTARPTEGSDSRGSANLARQTLRQKAIRCLRGGNALAG